MQKSLCTLILITLSLSLFAQGKLTKKRTQTWNADYAFWEDYTVETWRHNEFGNYFYFKKLREREDFYSYQLENNQIDSIFNDQGQLITYRNKSWQDSILYMWELHFFYKQSGELEREEYHWYNSGIKELSPYSKIEYLWNQGAENLNIIQHWNWYTEDEQWELIYETREKLDNNGCVIESSYSNYPISDQQELSESKTVYERDENCRLIESINYFKDGEGPFIPFAHLKIEYLNDDRLEITTSDVYDEETEEWTNQSVTEKEWDEHGNLIRDYTFVITNFNNGFHEWLLLASYDEKHRRTESAYYSRVSLDDSLTLNVRLLQEYIDDENDRLIKSIWRQVDEQGNTLFKTIYKYEYYCDGQLKAEYWENLPSIWRIYYEYDSGGDCPIEKEDYELVLYPNPSNGFLKITSNILLSSNAQVSIYNAVGKVVHAETITSHTEFFDLDLNNLPNGQYVVILENEGVRMTEKLVLAR